MFLAGDHGGHLGLYLAGESGSQCRTHDTAVSPQSLGGWGFAYSSVSHWLRAPSRQSRLQWPERCLRQSDTGTGSGRHGSCGQGTQSVCYKSLQGPGSWQHSSEGGRPGPHRQGTHNLPGRQILAENYRIAIDINEPKENFMGLKSDSQD